SIPLPTLPAIIKLRDADGAVIRNNRFIVRASFPWGRKAEAAINLLESKNVLIENNQLEDVKALVGKDELSTTVEQGNVLR
ncbi:MAG: right-handed parallel beta-helix repeat-containing protein, partial [Noviherbaspirillum sp.]